MNKKNPPFKLMLVLDFLSRKPAETLDIAERAIDGGVDAIQLREKSSPSGSFLQIAEGLYPICKRNNALLIINDRVDIAQIIEADGVHLPVAGLPPEYVREMVGMDMLVGRSSHNLEELRMAISGGCDYAILGPVFDTPSKTGLLEPLTIDGFRKISEQVDIPVIAIGGIDTSNARECISAGAIGIAVVRAIVDAEDQKKSALLLSKMLS